MYQRLEGQQKIDLVKKQIMPSWLRAFFKDPKSKATLIRFGQNSKSCGSSEIFIDLNKNDFANKVRELHPKPYAETALVPALELLQKKFEKKTLSKLIIVSDGENSCGGDPCDGFKKLKETHPELVTKILYMGTEEKPKTFSCPDMETTLIKNSEILEKSLESIEKEEHLSESSSAQTADASQEKSENQKIYEPGFLKILNIPEDEAFSMTLLKPMDRSQLGKTSEQKKQNGLGSELVKLDAGSYLVKLEKWNVLARARINPGKTTYLDYFESFRLPPANIKVVFAPQPMGIEFTLKSGRGRSYKEQETIKTSPGVNTLQITAPPHLLGIKIEGLLFRPNESYELDLKPYLGVFKNESKLPVFVRNIRLFEIYSDLKEGSALYLRAKNPIALAPGQYVIEQGGIETQTLDMTPLTTEN